MLRHGWGNGALQYFEGFEKIEKGFIGKIAKIDTFDTTFLSLLQYS